MCAQQLEHCVDLRAGVCQGEGNHGPPVTMQHTAHTTHLQDAKALCAHLQAGVCQGEGDHGSP
eukprot:scaffold8670_cov22-Tisochrysis_lutea.AAC.1